MRVTQDVLAVLSMAKFAGNTMTLQGQLERKLYVAAAKVIEAAGGKWNRGAQAHVFPDDAASAVDPIILTGEVISAKKDFQAFYTPEDLAYDVVARADVRPGMTVLEPNAGKGALVIPAHKAGGVVSCIDINEDAMRKIPHGYARNTYVGNFLGVQPDNFKPFDRVVMNPPFARQADIDHVMHALRFLKVGGILTAIMSAGVEFREDRKAKDFRNLIVPFERGTIERLPQNSFAASGTNVNTVLVTLSAAA